MPVKDENEKENILMKALRISVVVTILMMAAPLTIPADSGTDSINTISIESVIHRALARNPDITMIQEQLGMAQDALAQTRSLFLPRIALYAEAKTGDSPSAYLFKTIDQRSLLPNTDFNDPGTVDNVETGLRFQMNLFHGGMDLAARNMAQSHVRKTRALVSKTKNMIVSSAIRLFFSILKAKSYIAIAQQSVSTLEEELRVMNVHFQEGGVLRSDLLSLKVRLSQAKRDLIHARNAHAVTLTALNTLLGNLPDTPLTLAEQCACPFVFPATYQEAVQTALKKRPEILMAKQMIETAQWEERQAKGQYLPRLDLDGAWYTDADKGSFDAKSNNYVLGVSLNWDVFTGGTTGLEIAGAEKSLALARKNLEKVRLSIYQEVKQAYLNHEDALHRMDVAGKGAEMAEESLELVSRRYEGGSEPVTRYLETELARNQSRMKAASPCDVCRIRLRVLLPPF